MLLPVWLGTALAVPAQTGLITTREAKNHVGEKDRLREGRGHPFCFEREGPPTSVPFDQPYPDQIFTLVIWGSDRAKFGRPEEIYRDKELCVTGKITSYLGIPEIVASNPNQVQVQK
jgi:hypothetical protein